MKREAGMPFNYTDRYPCKYIGETIEIPLENNDYVIRVKPLDINGFSFHIPDNFRLTVSSNRIGDEYVKNIWPYKDIVTIPYKWPLNRFISSRTIPYTKDILTIRFTNLNAGCIDDDIDYEQDTGIGELTLFAAAMISSCIYTELILYKGKAYDYKAVYILRDPYRGDDIEPSYHIERYNLIEDVCGYFGKQRLTEEDITIKKKVVFDMRDKNFKRAIKRYHFKKRLWGR